MAVPHTCKPLRNKGLVGRLVASIATYLSGMPLKALPAITLHGWRSVTYRGNTVA